MKNAGNVLEIHFKSLKSFIEDATNAVSKRKTFIQSKNIIYFELVTGFRNFMTIQKIEILTVIATLKPSTIYELAKLVDRDFAGVLRDCTALDTTGFITLKKTKDARSSIKPTLKFAYSKILVYLPRSPYQIEFKRVA